MTYRMKNTIPRVAVAATALCFAFFGAMVPMRAAHATPIPDLETCDSGGTMVTTYACTCTSGSKTSPVIDSVFTAQMCNDTCYNSFYQDGTYNMSCTATSTINKSISLTYTMNEGAIVAPDDTLPDAPEETEPTFTVPILNIQIPGFKNFETPTKSADGSVVSVNFLATYINAIYAWALGAGALVAVVMMMLGGLQYVLSRGKSKYIEKAKTRITNAITGLVLLLAAYNIAFLIDPNTTILKSLDVTNVDRLEYFPPEGEEESDAITANASLTGATVPISGDFITAYSGAAVDSDALTALQSAAKAFHAETGKNVVITSATRDLTKQATLFYNYCLKTGGVCSPTACNPASTSVVKKVSGKYTLMGKYASETDSSSIISDIVANAQVSNCPHTSAIALDAWCDDGGSDYRHDVECQTELIQAMIGAGFCRLSLEPWHFELDTKKVSAKSCSTSWNDASYLLKNGTTETPGADCQKWDFKQHRCAIKKP